jgi:hypothetical protein
MTSLSTVPLDAAAAAATPSNGESKSLAAAEVNSKTLAAAEDRSKALGAAEGSKVCALITSTLVTDPNKPLSYTSTRSVYSPLQRLEQTILSVKSVLARIPDAYVLVSDNSKTLDRSFVDALEKAGAEVIHSHGQDADSVFKALGEAHGTQVGLSHLKKQKREFDIVLKLSGRYHLTDAFDLKRFARDKMTFWRDPGQTMVRTVLYAVPAAMIGTWERCLQAITSGRSGDGYEQQMYRQVRVHAAYVDVLGVAGHVSVNGEYFSG